MIHIAQLWQCFLLTTLYTMSSPFSLSIADTREKILLYGLFALLLIRSSIDYIGLFVHLNLPLLGTLSLSQLFALSVIPLMFLFFFFYFHHLTQTPFLLPFVLMIVLAAVTIPFSPLPNTQLALYEILRIASIVFVYALSYSVITTRERFFALAHVILLIALIPLLFAGIQFIFGVGYTDVAFSELRIFGSFTHPNIYGTFLLVIITTALIVLSGSQTKKMTAIALGMLVLNFGALTLTFTRIAWLVGMIMIALYMLVKNRLLVLPFFILVISAYLFVPQIHDRIHEAMTLSPDSSLVWRFNLWHDTVFVTTSDGHALFGNGTGTFMDLAQSIRGDLFGDLEPHNEYVRAYVENGLIGLGIFLFYTITFLIVTAKNALHAPTRIGRNVFFLLNVLFIALSIASLTDHIFRSTPLQWILMALVGGALATFARKSTPSTTHSAPYI